MNTGSQRLLKILLNFLLILILFVHPVFAATDSGISVPSISLGTIPGMNSQIPEVKQVLDRTVLSRQIPTIGPPIQGTTVIGSSRKNTVNNSLSNQIVSDNYTSQTNQSANTSMYLKSRISVQGKLVDQWITGPGLPPKGWQMNQNLPSKSSLYATSLTLGDVPTMS